MLRSTAQGKGENHSSDFLALVPSDRVAAVPAAGARRSTVAPFRRGEIARGGCCLVCTGCASPLTRDTQYATALPYLPSRRPVRPPVPPRFAFLFVFLGVLLGTVGCTRVADEGLPTEADLAALPEQESWDAVLRMDEGGRPRLVLRAPYLARYDRPPDSLFLHLGPDPAGGDAARVHVELYDAAGAASATVQANRVRYYDEERRLVAEGDVDVTTAGGRQLESEAVAWDEETRQLRADGAFRFTSPAERIQGVGLVATEDLARYSFRQASGELEVQE